MTKLPLAFFKRANVVQIARELIGKVLLTNFDGKITSGRIVETEAYNGVGDRASHAYGGRRTNRTEIMFGSGGTAYVYLCYGIHHLFNVVTNISDVPHAVLIRAIEPMEGMEVMEERVRAGGSGRTNKSRHPNIGKGPGVVSKALGIDTSHTGLALQESISIFDDGFQPARIVETARIGVDYAGADALLPYRFYLAGSQYVSGKRIKEER